MYKKISILISVLFLLAACSEGFAPKRAFVNVKESPSVIDPIRAEGQRLYNRDCSSCHGTLPYPSSNGLFSNQPDVSHIQIQNAIDNNLGGMGRFASTLSDADLAAITRALTTETGNGPVEVKKSSLPSNSQLKIGTRSYITSKMLKIFGPNGTPIQEDSRIRDIINNLVNDQVSSVEGFCNRYEDNCPGQLSNNIEASMSPSPSTTRKGYTGRVCSEVLSRNRAVFNVLQKVRLNPTSDVNRLNVTEIHKIFRPGVDLSDESLRNLLELSGRIQDQELDRIEAWRFVMLSFCVSSTFEVL